MTPKSISAFLAVVTACATPSLVLAEDSNRDDGIEIRVLQHTDQTDDSLKFLREGIANIPMPIQRQIRESGVYVLLAPRFVDAEPEQSGNTVFRNGGDTENVGGMFQPRKNRVLIPERASHGHAPPTPQRRGLVGIARHELGHAWDASLDHISNSPAFIKEYDQDFSHLDNSQCRKFSYFITGVSRSDANVPTGSGHAECWAGVFDRLCSPDTKKNDALLEAFPHVVKFMERIEPRLAVVPQAVQGGYSPSTNNDVPSSPYIKNNINSDPAIPSECAKAQALIAVGKYQEALMCLDRAIKAYPGRSKLYFVRGNCYMWLRRYKDAIKNYNSYLWAFPGDAEAHRQRANALGWLGQASQQQFDLRRADELSRKVAR